MSMRFVCFVVLENPEVALPYHFTSAIVILPLYDMDAGYAGVLCVGGIRIAGLSGIYKGHDYHKGLLTYLCT